MFTNIMRYYQKFRARGRIFLDFELFIGGLEKSGLRVNVLIDRQRGILLQSSLVLRISY